MSLLLQLLLLPMTMTTRRRSLLPLLPPPWLLVDCRLSCIHTQLHAFLLTLSVGFLIWPVVVSCHRCVWSVTWLASRIFMRRIHGSGALTDWPHT